MKPKQPAKPRTCKCGAQITRTVGLCRTRCMACHWARQGKQAAIRGQRRELKLPAYSLTRIVGGGVTRPLGPKPVTHRSRALLDLAHDVHSCMNCGAHAEAGCEPAHANGAEWGKGLSKKSDDWAHAAVCHGCHAWLDQPGAWTSDPTGRYADTRDDRRAMWVAAHFKTMALYWRSGWIKVAA